MGYKSAAIVVAAGSGLRFGGLKQLEMINNRRVIDISLEIAARSVDYVVCVVTPGVDFGALSADMVVDGGPSRSASVRCGLSVLPEDFDLVVVHDAARPMASPEIYREILTKLSNGSQAVVPVLAVNDTIKRVVNSKVVSTLDRSELVYTQTPQGFRRSVLMKAHESGLEATDDAHLVEMLGVPVDVIDGEKTNFKITTKDDFDRIIQVMRGGVDE